MGWGTYLHFRILINKQGVHMTQVNIEVGKVSDLLYDLMTQTKAKKFRAGFIKTDGSYRVGKFDLLNRSTWKQTDGTMYKRKGKKRTTDPDEYILAHDLDKKAPRNISVKRLKWFSVGKKVYEINHLELSDDITLVMFEKVKFTELKKLLSGEYKNLKVHKLKGELDE